MARCRHVLSHHAAPAAATATAAAPPPASPLPPAASYASGPPPPINQPASTFAPHPPFLSLTSELLALVASFLEGGHMLRTLPLVAAPFADNIDVLIGLGTHSLLLHARNLPLLERLAPRLHSLSRLVVQGCRPLRCLGLDTPVTPRDDELLSRLERVLATTHPRPAIAHSLRRLACDDLSLEDEAACACMGRILARLPRLAVLELPHAQISDKGMGRMLEAILAGSPPGEEEATASPNAGYSVSCVTSLRELDLADNMLEGPSVLETLLACFPSLRALRLHDNFFPPTTVDAALRRLAPHLLPLPSTDPPTPASMDQRRHPLLPLPSSYQQPQQQPPSPGGILQEEEMAASPLPFTRSTPAAPATATAATTPSPCTTAAFVASASVSVVAGPTTPTRNRPSCPSSAAAALTFGFSSAASSSSGPPPPRPSTTHPPRRPVSYAERLMLAESKAQKQGRASPLERAMREEDSVGMEEAEEEEGVGRGLVELMEEGDDDETGPLQDPPPPPKRTRRVGEGTEAAGGNGGEGVLMGVAPP